MRFFQILVLLLACGIIAQEAGARPSEAAIRLVNERRYAKALPLMEQQARLSPNDVSAHYYMAVCLFALGRLDRAEQEYCWVAYKGGHGDFKVKAQAGLAQLRKYKEALARARARQAPAAASKTASSSAPSRKAENDSAQKYDTANGASVGTPARENLKRIILVERGEPGGLSTALNRLDGSGITVERVDPDDETSGDLLARYGVKEPPALLYLDEKGELLRKQEGTITEEMLNGSVAELK